MKNFEVFLLSLAAFCLIFSLSHAQSKKGETPNAEGANVEEQVKSMTHEMIKASLNADTSVLERYYADDCLIVHGDGKLSTKTQELGDFKSGDVKYDSLDVHEEKVGAYGDTGFDSVLVFVKGTIHGKPLSADVRATRVWVKGKDGWKNTVFQVTRVASPSQ